MEASRHIRRFVRRQPILVAAALGALVTMALVPPSPTYLDYLDLHVLVLLFCLMTCVAGLQRAGLFSWVATLMLGTPRSARFVSAVLAGLCFVGSMFVTNDVALITFVPLGIYLFRVAKQERLVARVAVIQTLAANMGSMLTPIGNPQNLFLCSRYGIEPFSLLIVVAPVASLASLITLQLYRKAHLGSFGRLLLLFLGANALLLGANCALWALLYL